MKKLEKLIEFGFYLFIFLLPWQTRLIWREAAINGSIWEYGRFCLYGTELLLWAVLFLYLIWLFKNKRFKKINLTDFFSRLKDKGVLIYWLIVLFVLIGGFSIFWALDYNLAYNRWLTLLEAVAICSMILIFNFKIEKIAIAWVLTSAIQGVFAVWQFFSQYIFPNKWLGLAEHWPTVAGSIILQTDAERWLRAYGSLPHPNILGGFLTVSLLFLIYLALQAKTQSQRIFVLASLLAIIPGLFFTFSRSAWLAAIFSFIVLAFWLWQKKDYFLNQTFLKVFFLMFLMVVILAINLQNPLLVRFQGEQKTEVASIQLRMTFTEQAWQLTKDSPLLGQGIGNYTLGVYQKINPAWPGYYYQPVHNIYILALAELGIFGALVFYLILFYLISALIKNAFSLEKIILFLALISILIISLFDHYFWTLYFGVVVFWLILGLNLKSIKAK
ncbi:MAG: O-antigen ligase family protein [Candidatus Buchananbacteria bacterium]